MKRSLIANIMQPFEQFAKAESSSGILLLVMTIVALILANSPLAEAYFHFLETPVTLPIGPTPIERSLTHWISDGLMVLFFFIVGLEIKREFISGELSNWKHAMLPIFGAFGGMIVPALIFTIFNGGTQHSAGWGIPMATDIAFALGVVTLLGKRVPASLKIFLIALAIIDDIGAVIVIALFYTREIHVELLLIGITLLGILLAGNRFGIRGRWFYAIVGIIVWYVFLESGVHATVAGVLVASTVPAERTLPLFEKSLSKFVAFIVMPIFVLANAGVQLQGQVLGALSSDLGLGIIVGLIAGKPLGIFLFSYLSVRVGFAKLPATGRFSELLAIGMLGGIGFTMSLFITGLAFTDFHAIENAKLSILIASLTASLLGWIAFSAGNRRKST